MTSTKSRTPALRPGDRKTRQLMREAHDAGRHGDGTKEDVLSYWAETCADCNAQHYYEHGSGSERIR
jgi:hypothetical protein